MWNDAMLQPRRRVKREEFSARLWRIRCEGGHRWLRCVLAVSLVERLGWRDDTRVKLQIGTGARRGYLRLCQAEDGRPLSVLGRPSQERASYVRSVSFVLNDTVAAALEASVGYGATVAAAWTVDGDALVVKLTDEAAAAFALAA